jgi:two-component system, NarL family, invasion response regulator UvrY
MRATWRAPPRGSTLWGIAMSSAERTETIHGGRARVLAVDDHVPFLAVLHDVVTATGHLEIVGEAQCGESAVAAAHELHPDMVLMDVRMPGIGGIEAAERIKARSPSTVVVLISTTHPDELPLHGADTFVDAVIWKSRLRPRLLDEIWLQFRNLPSRS